MNALTYVDDALTLDVPGCRITQRLRIDAKWMAAMGKMLDLAFALYRGHLSPVDVYRAIRAELELEPLSWIERRIILDYATHRAEA